MTLRTRVTVAAGLAVLVVVAVVHVTVYFSVRSNLRDQVDDSLRHEQLDENTSALEHLQTSSASEALPLARDIYLQTVSDDGTIDAPFGDRPLPVTGDVLAVARGERDEVFFDADVDGVPVRVYATRAGPGTALQIGRSLSEVEASLRQLGATLVVASIGAIVLAAVLGRLVAATAAAPVHRVADAADAVARTGELSHHIDVPGCDDLGRLAVSFNTMLDALSESLARQRRLVADASHELRTPLTTLRTNVEVLGRWDELAPTERATLIRDTVAQTDDLTRLIENLVELAREGDDEPFTTVDLDELARQVVGVARRRHPAVGLHYEGSPSVIHGAPGAVMRAVSNLIDNAAVHGTPRTVQPGGSRGNGPRGDVEITVRDSAVRVRDHGPGFDTADLPHVFDRFYRSPEARTKPGSGLGLAIVNQVAVSHGGHATAANANGGGAEVTIRFPTSS